MIRLTILSRLSRLKHNVKTAENGLIALNMIKQSYASPDERDFDVCFLDNQVRKLLYARQMFCSRTP